MFGAISNYLEPRLLDEVFNGVAFVSPATHIALFTVMPGEAGGGTEVTGGSYARVQVNVNGGASPQWRLAASAAPAFQVSNLNAITYPTATADWGEVVAWAAFDAATVGNMLWWGWLSTLEYLFTGLNAGDVFSAPAHTLLNNDRVILKAGTTALPTGVSEDTVYFVVGVSGITFQLSLTQGGAAITLTADGSGYVDKLSPRTVLNGDTATFAIDALVASLS